MTSVAHPNMMDLLMVCSEPLPDDVEQFEEVTGTTWNVDKVANSLYRVDGYKFALYDDDSIPFAIFGMEPVIPGVWQTWMISTEDAWVSHWKAITRDCRKIISTLFKEDDVRRIQTLALTSRTDACNWYEKGLRMTLESVAKGFGVTGRDVSCYVRLRE